VCVNEESLRRRGGGGGDMNQIFYAQQTKL
jgi:hypothetical protein